MKQIPLTKGQFALVDDEDFERVNQYKWSATFDRCTNKYYAKRMRNDKNIFSQMHRFIMQTPIDMQCDHINGDTLDNRKSNLRNCSQSENIRNRGTQKNNNLGEKNITHRQNKNKYRVRIKQYGKIVFTKHCDTLEEAIQVRDEALKKYHGEFANNGR